MLVFCSYTIRPSFAIIRLSSAETLRIELKTKPSIPTGVAFDIHRQIEKRRAQQAVRPERLSPETPITRVVQVNVVAPQDKLAAPPDNMVKDEPDNPV
jgi:hypothetical protein